MESSKEVKKKVVAVLLAEPLREMRRNKTNFFSAGNVGVFSDRL